MTSKYIEKDIRYEGTQLASHFAYRNFKISGDSIVAFEGPVDVRLTEMVDLEDVINREPISSDRMLNFIVELFDLDLKGTICLQRLLTAIACEESNRALNGIRVERKGDDLYFDGRKLSVSIATSSPVSTMIHFAMNIEKTGAPIPVSCLKEMGLEPREFGNNILRLFTEEFNAIRFARVKVNWVK